MSLANALEYARRIVSHAISPGDTVVDATVGTGIDTLFLAQRVGLSGEVYGFDIQEEAILTTRERLRQAGVLERASLLHRSHEHLSETIPKRLHGSVRCVMFHLGYLPGGADKSCLTLPYTTVPALDQAIELLAPGGLLTVVLYTGQFGGGSEAGVVERWARSLDSTAFTVLSYKFINQQHDPPWLIAVQKNA